MLKDDGGASQIGNLQTWTLGSMIMDELDRKQDPKTELAQRYIQQLPQWLHYAPANEWPPLEELDPDSYFFDVLQDKISPATRAQMNLLDSLKKLSIPALFIGGWFDGLLQPTLNAYRAYGGPKMLWIGPWTHEEMTGRAGEKVFAHAQEKIGIDAVQDPTELHILWFDHWLKEQPIPIQKPVHLYLMGQKKWAAFETWPPSHEEQEWYLHSHGASQTRHGDGKLEQEPLQTNTCSRLKLDPAHPVPTRGGGLLLAGHPSGMLEQGEIQDRKDVLVYTSPPLQQDLDILGSVTACIWASAPSPLLDLFIRLCDVEPDGRVYNVVDTFYRQKVKEKDTPLRIEALLHPTAYRFQAGHRLRVDIAASNAPHFDINLNNGQTSKTASTGPVAEETIYHGTDYPSKIIFPMSSPQK